MTTTEIPEKDSTELTRPLELMRPSRSLGGTFLEQEAKDSPRDGTYWGINFKLRGSNLNPNWSNSWSAKAVRFSRLAGYWGSDIQWLECVGNVAPK